MAKRSKAERILIVEVVLFGAAFLALLIKELPGAIREVRMWQMASFRGGSASSRTRKA